MPPTTQEAQDHKAACRPSLLLPTLSPVTNNLSSCRPPILLPAISLPAGHLSCCRPLSSCRPPFYGAHPRRHLDRSAAQWRDPRICSKLRISTEAPPRHSPPHNAIFSCHSEAKPRNPRISLFLTERSDAHHLSTQPPLLPLLSSHGDLLLDREHLAAHSTAAKALPQHTQHSCSTWHLALST